jgi:hypothetical protein
MSKLIVIWQDSEGSFEDQRFYTAHAILNNSDKGIKEAIELVDKHPDALVIYGEVCKVIKKHTQIELPDGLLLA